jgi:hypothetical protein
LLVPTNNIQLTGNEVTAVWVNTQTQRIVGFAPQNCFFPGISRCLCIPLHHANEISTWADRYRAQQKADFEERQYAQITKDDAVRKRIREALRARRNVVGPLQRADIDRGLRFLDTIEARMKPQAPEGALLIERCESTKRKEDIALESPAFKPQPILPRKLLTAGG